MGDQSGILYFDNVPNFVKLKQEFIDKHFY